MDSEDFQTPTSFARREYINRRQYLITYGQADLVKFPTHQSFGEAVVSRFHNSGKVTVDYWACCLEEYENTSGQHYYVCVKLSGPKRWSPVKNLHKERLNITVNFSENHSTITLTSHT